MVLENEREHSSQWSAIVSIASKIGCAPETLRKWVRRTEVDTGRRWMALLFQGNEDWASAL